MRVYGKNVAKEVLDKSIKRVYLAKNFNDQKIINELNAP